MGACGKIFQKFLQKCDHIQKRQRLLHHMKTDSAPRLAVDLPPLTLPLCVPTCNYLIVRPVHYLNVIIRLSLSLSVFMCGFVCFLEGLFVPLPPADPVEDPPIPPARLGEDHRSGGRRQAGAPSE